jgi:hypothetical protein
VALGPVDGGSDREFYPNTVPHANPLPAPAPARVQVTVNVKPYGRRIGTLSAPSTLRTAVTSTE